MEGSIFKRKVGVGQKCVFHRDKRAALLCSKCGRPLCRRCVRMAWTAPAMPYCRKHARELNPPGCTPMEEVPVTCISRRSMNITALLTLLFGWSGLHRFYLGRWITGAILLCFTIFTLCWGLAPAPDKWAELVTAAKYATGAVVAVLGLGVYVWFHQFDSPVTGRHAAWGRYGRGRGLAELASQHKGQNFVDIILLTPFAICAYVVYYADRQTGFYACFVALVFFICRDLASLYNDAVKDAEGLVLV